MRLDRLRATVIISLIAAVNLLLLFIAPPAEFARLVPKHPLLWLLADVLLITIGIAAQAWMRDKPKYQRLKLLAYMFTLAFCVSMALVIVEMLMNQRYSHAGVNQTSAFVSDNIAERRI
jgi:hypothetical protein